MLGDTAPSRQGSPVPQPTEPSMDEYQPIRVGVTKPLPDIRRGEHRRVRWGRWALALLVLLILVYFLAPFRTNVLILGVDDSPARGPVGRSDTMILATLTPYYIGMLGMPRDLWLN